MTNAEIGELVRETRVSQGLSYRDLAERCGMERSSTRALRKVENGEDYALGTLVMVCDALGLELLVRRPRKNSSKSPLQPLRRSPK